MMMQAGMSYRDWADMAPFQRQDFRARMTVKRHEIEQKLSKSDSLGDFIGLTVAKVLGLF